MKQATRFIVCASLMMIVTLAGCGDKRGRSRSVKSEKEKVEIVVWENTLEGEIRNTNNTLIKIEIETPSGSMDEQPHTEIIEIKAQQTEFREIHNGQEFTILRHEVRGFPGWTGVEVLPAPKRPTSQELPEDVNFK